MPRPFLGYFHMLPPHYPYVTRKEFYRFFEADGFNPAPKPEHLFTENYSDKELKRLRRKYDEFILYVDAEFGRLIESLEQTGSLDNTWILFTSDHGEMIERGIRGHGDPPMFQPVVQVPLLISAPGQKERNDIYANTSSLDILPTLLKLTEQEIPGWLEGEILPPYRNSALNSSREIYSVNGRQNPQFNPLTKATLTLFKENYKLSQYMGYDELGNNSPMFELFDLDSDPEELNNLFNVNRSMTKTLSGILQTKLDEINSKYL
jgi:arylsulfatase A-like enzyme